MSRILLTVPRLPRRFLVPAAISVAALVGFSVPAVAVPADVVQDAYITTDFGVVGFGTHSVDPCTTIPGRSCALTYTASYANGDMEISANGTATYPTAGNQYNITGTFYFKILGPTNSFVPILITASASTSAGPDSLTEALITISNANPVFNLRATSCDPVTLPPSYCDNATGGGSFPSSFSGTYTASVAANSQSAFSEFLRLYDYSSVSASIDPMIAIDPTWLANNPGYSLIFSPNVGGVTPTDVPEPFTLSIFGAGFAGAVAMRRRKARKA